MNDSSAFGSLCEYLGHLLLQMVESLGIPKWPDFGSQQFENARRMRNNHALQRNPRTQWGVESARIALERVVIAHSRTVASESKRRRPLAARRRHSVGAPRRTLNMGAGAGTGEALP